MSLFSVGRSAAFSIKSVSKIHFPYQTGDEIVMMLKGMLDVHYQEGYLIHDPLTVGRCILCLHRNVAFNAASDVIVHYVNPL